MTDHHPSASSHLNIHLLSKHISHKPNHPACAQAVLYWEVFSGSFPSTLPYRPSLLILPNNPPPDKLQVLTLPLPPNQETNVAPLESAEGTTAQTPAAGGQGGRHRQRRPAAERGRGRKGGRPLVQRDAARGGDAAQGQVHHLRSQGEALPQGHPQSVVTVTL